MNLEWVENTLSGMTLEEKVGQLLMVTFFQADEKIFPEISEKIKKYHVGGYFHSFNDYNTQAEFNKRVQETVKIPLLIGGDYETGVGYIIEGATVFPRPMARGWKKDAEIEYEIGKITALQGRAIGSNITFSPVVDLNTNRLCPDINNRAYGEDVETVSELAIPYIKGIQDYGMIATPKHFPGNGGTDMDQHIHSAIIPFSKEEMEEKFLKVYENIFQKANPGAIMVAHLEVPSLTTEINLENNRLFPASLSKEILFDLLRDKMKYTGITISDAMNMGGVTTHLSRAAAAVKAVKAGIDMLLIFSPDDFDIEYFAILKAVEQGDISEERINAAVRNILIAKTKVNLDKTHGMPLDKNERDEIFQKKYEHISFSVAENAVTVLRNYNEVLPIGDINGKDIAVLNVFQPDTDLRLKQGQSEVKVIISELLKEKGANVKTYSIEPKLSLDELKKILGDINKESNYIFLNFFVIPNWGIGTLIPNHNALRLFMFGLLTCDIPVIITSFGDPYVFYYSPAAKIYINAFDETLYTQETVVKIWLGEIIVKGKMPVGLPGMYKKGDGIEIVRKNTKFKK